MACEGVTMIAMCVYVIDAINCALAESVGWDKFWLGQCSSVPNESKDGTLMMFSESMWQRPSLVLHALLTHVLLVKYHQK